MRFNIPIFGVLAMLTLLGSLGLTGCSTVLPATLEAKLVSNATAEDHLAAAMLYQNKARELEAEAMQFETAVSNVVPTRIRRGFIVQRYGAQRKKNDMVRHRCSSCMFNISVRHAPYTERCNLNNVPGGPKDKHAQEMEIMNGGVGQLAVVDSPTRRGGR